MLEVCSNAASSNQLYHTNRNRYEKAYLAIFELQKSERERDKIDRRRLIELYLIFRQGN